MLEDTKSKIQAILAKLSPMAEFLIVVTVSLGYFELYRGPFKEIEDPEYAETAGVIFSFSLNAPEGRGTSLAPATGLGVGLG